MVGLGSADTVLAAGAGKDGKAATKMRCEVGKENSLGERGGDADEDGHNFGQSLISGPETPGIDDKAKPLLEENNGSGSSRILHTCNI